jgi:hypothetical protein
MIKIGERIEVNFSTPSELPSNMIKVMFDGSVLDGVSFFNITYDWEEAVYRKMCAIHKDKIGNIEHEFAKEMSKYGFHVELIQTKEEAIHTEYFSLCGEIIVEKRKPFTKAGR